MKSDFAVLNTDRVNRKNIRFPAAVLMRAEEEHVREAWLSRAPLGTPAHMQHDMHRVIGWSQNLGHYIDGEMVRVLGRIDYPENDADRDQLQTMVACHRRRVNDAQTRSFRDELSTKIGLLNDPDLTFIRMEAVFARREGLAANLYPEFFAPGADLVDKDGLVDYQELLSRTVELLPGVFHDKNRDLVLVAHRFFRRRLSHLNSLNIDFLSRFAEVAKATPGIRARIRLDPDLLGHSASVRSLIELEYWRGPKYNDDISKIPNGVAEHKADDHTRRFEGVDRTQIWWKAPETRIVDGVPTNYRTFEVEELIEDPSPGLADGRYGCRYAHAEYSDSASAITHFDGAIRAYSGEKYLSRIDLAIDHAGKHSEYTKLFRFDGRVSVPQWKRLLSDHYRGNNLIPEYLGTPAEPQSPRGATQLADLEQAAEPPLAVLISLGPGRIADGTMLYQEHTLRIGDHLVPFVEVGVGAVAQHFNGKHDDQICPIGYRDGILNLSRLGIAGSDKTSDRFADQVGRLADALEVDIEGGQTRQVAIPIMWDSDDIVVTLTLAGQAAPVLALLRQLPCLIDLNEMPSEWIEAVARTVTEIAPVKNAAVMWKGVDRGVLEIRRGDEVEVQFPAVSPFTNAFMASGLLGAADQFSGAPSE
ncbi:hypothetical protein E0H22_22875 [Rhodopseudomonas boonkerdii]|uniref:hypothetical protein n=1 Tax=Rhodopseudomonas boonkerdii TaxID=475937 RepID=UPI001E420054|nr:hypothetical protein [Rhodopseudomonas boonkerdii]UGV28270.1 hypothetical protein E0H22_22875 [Rhodopseudomonas boonkerdii]